tara:strand:- start:3356 stop:3922 length:567 start_codon:yes stop_codon:yes gene_type:complete
MEYSMWNVSEDLERLAFVHAHQDTAMTATSWNTMKSVLMTTREKDPDFFVPYRTTYRLQAITRIKKMVEQGWNVIRQTHSSPMFTKIASMDEIRKRLNNDSFCAISHEDFQVGSIVVKLNSSHLSWESFKKYLETSLTFYLDGSIKCLNTSEMIRFPVCAMSTSRKDYIEAIQKEIDKVTEEVRLMTD